MKKKTTKYLLMLSFLVGMTLMSCQSNEAVATQVQHKGVLREIMMMGQLQARADLKDYEQMPNLYALGAIEGLAGEILIINGQPFNGKVMDEALMIQNDFELKAALLVSSQVEAWDTLRIDSEITDLNELQAFIPARLSQMPTEAFPFQILGSEGSLKWHVINAPGASSQDHDAYKASGLSGSVSNEPVQILGFYSENHEGVFTHHGSYLHMHFIDQKKQTMGHIDEFKWSGSMQLLIPKSLNP